MESSGKISKEIPNEENKIHRNADRQHSQEAEAGIAVEELSRKHGFSKSTFYKWKAKYSGIDASALKRLKELEEENRRLKQMYADLSLEHQALKDIVQKKL